jgi:cytochrome b561
LENRKYSSAFRLIHWTIAICLIFILITIFARVVWMDKNNIADIIERYFSTRNDIDVSLSREHLVRIGKNIGLPMWRWHVNTGYVLVALFCIRIGLHFFGQMKFSNPFDKQLMLKEKFQNWSYLIFYLGVAISLITGLIMEFGPRYWKLLMIQIHNCSNYYLIPFIIIHLSGVVLAEFTNQQGIVSKIISGTKKKEGNELQKGK